jgi:hypothetical protein
MRPVVSDANYMGLLTVECGFLLKINALQRQRCTELTFIEDKAGILDVVSPHLTEPEIDWRRRYNSFKNMWCEKNWSGLAGFLEDNFHLLTSERTGLQSEDIFNAIDYCDFKIRPV